MAIQEVCEVYRHDPLGNGIYAIVLHAPHIAEIAKPGQFVHLLCGEGNLLRRPISICVAEGERLGLVFQVKGEGTAWLAARCVGDTINTLGPLGNGFALDSLGERPVFIGGGIGVPPMLMAMQEAKKRGATPQAILGFRNHDMVILEDDFQSFGTTTIVTDDGSYGTHGLVTDVLKRNISQYTAVCACGPKPMLKAVADLAQKRGLPCQVSLEERMGCGIGACLVCACALKGLDGQTKFGHVCKDGPVFPAEEVVW